MKTGLLILSFIPVLLFANPTYDVTQGALQNNSALCGYGYNSNCTSKGSNSGRHIIYNTINLASKYGAYAVSKKTGNISSSFNENSKEKAKRVAINKCESIQGNGKCESLGWVRNGCLAIAVGKLGKKSQIFGIGKEKSLAEPAALKKCQKSGAKNCRILMPEECSLPTPN